VCDDTAPPDPLRECTLVLVRRASAPLSTDTLRATLGVRKQTLLGPPPAPGRRRPRSARRARWLDRQCPDGSGSGLYEWERERTDRMTARPACPTNSISGGGQPPRERQRAIGSVSRRPSTTPASH
jgi:hypothetical protein